MHRYQSIKSHLNEFNVANKRVFLRSDLNVPMSNGAITNDYRLKQILPTIDLIQKKGGKVILATHIGRPKNHEQNLSTKNLLSWFTERHYSIEFAENLEEAAQKSLQQNGTILLLENLRFWPGEKSDDKQFAQQLANLGDYYVNDAFATLHRHDTSITLVPQLFAPKKRTIGLLIERELHELQYLLTTPEKPFMVIIGGGKVSTKLPLIKNLFDKINIILLCPAIVFTFLKALGKDVGLSLVDNDALEDSKKILSEAQQRNVRVLFPIDYRIALNTFAGELVYVDAENFPHNGIGISTGPKTRALWTQEIMAAKTLFLNSAMGLTDRPETWHDLYELLKIVAQSSAFTVIGGGDSVAAAQQCGIDTSIDFLSTGGGATLAYLSGEQLPGLQYFK